MRHAIRTLTLSTLLATSVFENAHGDDFCFGSTPVAGEINVTFDDFRGVPDGTWNGNTGGVIGANLGVSLFNLFGLQAGGSYGVYDWYGRGPVVAGRSNDVQQQGFLTVGAFRRAPCTSGIQGAVALDWMFNKNFGVFALNPSCGQVRLQLGYLWECVDEFGVWGTIDVNKVHEDVDLLSVEFRAISQVSLFWRHTFCNFAETMVWVGLPYKKSLMFSDKRAGQYIIGASFRAPITESLSVEGHGVYMGPSKGSSSSRFYNYDANVSIGLSYAFNFGADCCEQASMAFPYLPVANNSNFLMDASLSD